MFMVLVLHIFGHGGVLDATQVDSPQYHVSWLMEIAAYCAVDTFAMVTGYLMINNRFKSGRILSLWIQVAFYALLFNAIAEIIAPGMIGIKYWIKSFVPVSGRLWWYFTAYFVLSFFIPFINRMIHSLNKRQAFILNTCIFVLFSIIGCIVPNDGFNLGAGYSTLWLAAMYIVGASVRKYDFMHSLKKRWCVLAYSVCVILTWTSRMVIRYSTVLILGKEFGVDVFINYLSPLVVFMSLSLLLFFRNVKFPSFVNKILALVSPLSFAVYIIHQHKAIMSWFIADKFVSLSTVSAIFIPFYVILIAVVIFVVCITIEALRFQLFKHTRLQKLINNLGCAIDKMLNLDL